MQPIAPYRVELEFNADELPPYVCDFQEVRGQEHVKRALEIAAASSHNLIMTGPLAASTF